MGDLFLQWYIQLGLIIVLAIILRIFKKYVPNFFKKTHLKKLDFLTIPILIAIHFISVGLFKLSLIPFIVFGMGFFGIVLAIIQYLHEEFRYKRFFIVYWRILDLIVIIIYFVLLVYQVVQVI
ncbi:DUF3397 family protein [Ligilactobacillus ceti]|uniref:DUF3397 family protein n=1 Tax=Ligilactobacillus ceti TaxID=395085 RepID=UPI0004825607|nr:DUF3397 family protein [Ligilactobacillus ceti]